jgi:hypothetical protein
MTLSSDGWRRVETLFHAVADLSDDAREALLSREVDADPLVVNAVRRLLAADAGTHDVLDANPSDIADALLRERSDRPP